MIALAKKSAPCFGISEKSISSSRRASTLFQSVLDRLFELLPLFTICLPERNDADGFVRSFSKGHKGNASVNRADSYPSFLAVILTSVWTNQKNATEHFFCVRKIETVLANIGLVLSFVPLKGHCSSNCNYTQNSFLRENGRQEMESQCLGGGLVLFATENYSERSDDYRVKSGENG